METLTVRVADSHNFDADPDHACYFDADSDPDHPFNFDADPDPDLDPDPGSKP